MFNKVKEFHTAFRILVSKSPTLPDMSIRDLRIKLLTEEWNEFHAAEKTDDFIEVVDGLVDCVYIICGSALSYGIAPQSQYEPYFSNLIVANPAFPDDNHRKARIDLIDRYFYAYLEAEANNDLLSISETLQSMLNAITGTAFVYNIPFNAAFDEVHSSNMSKLDENGNPIYREDGKVVKSPLFRKPDIAKILAQYSA